MIVRLLYVNHCGFTCLLSVITTVLAFGVEIELIVAGMAPGNQPP